MRYCFLLGCDLLLTTQLTWLGLEQTPLLTEVPFSMSLDKKCIVRAFFNQEKLILVYLFLIIIYSYVYAQIGNCDIKYTHFNQDVCIMCAHDSQTTCQAS